MVHTQYQSTLNVNIEEKFFTYSKISKDFVVCVK